MTYLSLKEMQQFAQPNTTSVQMKVLNEDLREYGLPKYETDQSAGMDLRAMFKQDDTTMFVKNMVIQPGQAILIPTGIAIHINNPMVAVHILPRSGFGHKRGLILGNSVGLIDSDYQNELFISLWNRGDENQVIEYGDRIAQMVLMPILRFGLVEVESFEHSDRVGGFGSTGVK